jgi:hypothetical protein
MLNNRNQRSAQQQGIVWAAAYNRGCVHMLLAELALFKYVSRSLPQAHMAGSGLPITRQLNSSVQPTAQTHVRAHACRCAQLATSCFTLTMTNPHIAHS